MYHLVTNATHFIIDPVNLKDNLFLHPKDIYSSIKLHHQIMLSKIRIYFYDLRIVIPLSKALVLD